MTPFPFSQAQPQSQSQPNTPMALPAAGSAPAALTPQALAPKEQAELGAKIKTFIQARVGDSGHAERLAQLATLRKQHFYWEGQQYLRPRYVGPATVDWRPMSAQDMAAKGAYATVFNIFRGDGTKLISVLANRAPNVEVQPLVEDDELGRRVAQAGSRVVQALRKAWDVDSLQQDIAFTAWVGGTFFIRLDWRQKEEYGSTQVLSGMGIETQTVETQKCLSCGAIDERGGIACANCGGPLAPERQELQIPSPQFEERLNGLPEPTVLDLSSVIVTQAAKDLEKSPFVIVEQEYYKGDLIAMWPQLGTQTPAQSPLMGDLGVFTRNSLTGKLYFAAVPDPNRWTMSEVWLQPSGYYSLDADRKVGDRLRQEYPQGLKATFVEGELMEVEAGRAGDWISWGKPLVSRTIYCQSLGYDFLPGQDSFNDYMNIFRETAERNLPLTLIDSKMLSSEALRKRAGYSGEFIPVMPTGGKGLGDAMHTVQTPKIEPSYTQWAVQAHDTVREAAGIQPALFGGETSHQLTALEADNRLQQALAQLSLVWTGMRKCWRGAYENALRALVRYGGEALLEEGCSREDLALLQEAFDQWGRLRRIRIEVQESIPATTAQIRSALQTVLQGGPEMWGMMELGSADNAERVRESIGLIGFVNKGEREREFLLQRVRGILAGAALPQIEADEAAALDPMAVLPILSNWVLGPEGRQAKQENPQGYNAVIEWVLQWKQLTIPQVPPEAEPAGGVSGGEAVPPGPSLPSALPGGGAPMGAPPPGASDLPLM